MCEFVDFYVLQTKETERIMDIAAFFIDLIKYTLAGSLVLGAAYWIYWPRYNQHVFRLKMLELKRETKKELLPLRLQAYERIVLFVERINPVNLVVRLHEPQLSAADFHQLLLREIRSEYEHNITQQLYVSDRAWGVTRQLKDQTVALIRNAVAGLPDTSTAKELSTTILSHLSQLEDDPYRTALGIIKNELPE